jgi:hypothetical protein
MRWVVGGAKHAEDRNRHLEFIKALQPVFSAIPNLIRARTPQRGAVLYPPSLQWISERMRL